MSRVSRVAKTAIIVIVFVIALNFLSVYFYKKENINRFIGLNSINILSSNENSFLDNYVKNVAKDNNVKIKITYMDDLEIIDELNINSKNYDGVWISNSTWLYMLKNRYLTSESKSISISPVVMGIRKNKAKELGLINSKIGNADILGLIKDKKINFVMPSVTKTNTGLSAYLGFLNVFAGSPETLSENMLNDKDLINNMKSLFSGVKRVSGDEKFLEEMFIKDDSYESIIASESSLININKELKEKGKEEVYLLYPYDGVPLNDSTLAFIDNKTNKKDIFLKFQKALLSDDAQEKLQNYGRRTWYGGITDKSNSDIFNKEWGIDTSKYLTATKYPSKKVMNKAINIYIEEMRKPSHTVFCLDYSGSMYGSGIDSLTNAMEYILTYDKASVDKLQFSKYDKITVIPFNEIVIDRWSSLGSDTSILLRNIKGLSPMGGTSLYDAIIDGINVLEKESDEYTKTIITMTDGKINGGTYRDMKNIYDKSKFKVPVYSIMFGSADRYELDEIASCTNGRVFDGRYELLEAFKEVRGYN